MRQGWPFPVQRRSLEIDESVSETSPAAGKTAYWNTGFGGVNMFSEADEADFEKAHEAGISVVRFGAVGDAQDFRYLVDQNGDEYVLCSETLDRMTAGIQRAADHGIKVIIALGHVPGRIFALESEQYDFRLWCSADARERFVALWSELAKYLRHFKNVVGYDLLNEPFTPDDVAQGYFDEMPKTYAGTLNTLYKQTIDAIRKWDNETPIILRIMVKRNLRIVLAIGKPERFSHFDLRLEPRMSRGRRKASNRQSANIHNDPSDQRALAP